MAPLPRPESVRERLSVAGMFTAGSFRYVQYGLEVFGNLNVDGVPVAIGVQVGRADAVESWPVTKGQVALCCWPLRVRTGSLPGFRRATDRLLETLSVALAHADWLVPLLQLSPVSTRRWALTENDEYGKVPQILKDLLAEADRLDLYMQFHTNCSQDCLFCPKSRTSTDPVVQDLDFKMLKNVVDQVIVPARQKGIPVSFGMDSNDLAAHRHTRAMMELISAECGCPIHLVVPANRLSDRAVAASFASMPGLYKLSTTIFGASPESHDKVAGRQGAFVETLRALSNLSTTPIWMNGHFVLTSYAISEIGSVADILAHFGVDVMIQFLLADCSAHNEKLRTLLPRADLVLNALSSCAGKVLAARDVVNVEIKDFPVCSVPPSLRHLASNHYDREAMFQYPVPACCADCVHLRTCIGVPQAYVDTYGTVGLVPEKS